jgi:hypothetical protein
MKWLYGATGHQLPATPDRNGKREHTAHCCRNNYSPVPRHFSRQIHHFLRQMRHFSRQIYLDR